MISRATLLLDRVATLGLAAVLAVAGLLGIWWWSGTGPLPSTTTTKTATSVVDAEWWPWVSAVGGLLLILLGLRWLAAHVARNTVSRLTLSGSGSDGKLDADGSKVAGAAATALTNTLGVRSANGSVRRNRGQLVANLKATLEPEADLALVAASADQVSSELSQVLDRKDLRCSVELTVARRGRSLPRVS